MRTSRSSGLKFSFLAALALPWLVSCRPGPGAAPGGGGSHPGAEAAPREPPGRSPGALLSEQRSLLEEKSKREAVALYPELGVAGTAVNREYIRRYKLYRSINPAFFAEPDWPKRLADMMAIDLGLDPRQ